MFYYVLYSRCQDTHKYTLFFQVFFGMSQFDDDKDKNQSAEKKKMLQQAKFML